MIFYIGVLVIAAGFAVWLANTTIPKRVPRYSRRPIYDKNRYMGEEQVIVGYRWSWYFYSWWTGLLGTLGIIMVGLLSVLLWALVLAGIQNIAQQSPTVTSQNDKNLVALAVGDGEQGLYFLASGYSQSYPTFRYLYEEEDGGVRLGEIYAANGVVYEGEKGSPYRTEFIWQKYDPWISPFVAYQAETYAFHIPTGSIANDYTVEVGE